MITSQWVWGENGKLEKFERTDYTNENDVKVIRLPIEGKDEFSRKFKRYYGLYAAIEGETPNILFIHGVSFCDVKTVVRYIRSHSDVRVYVDNHSDFSNSGTNWLSRNVLHKIIWKHNAQMLLPYTEKFYGVLPARVDWLVDMYGLPKEKCELLVMGVDDELAEKAELENRKDEIKKLYGISDSDFLVVSGGKIDVAKRQTLLLMEAIGKSKMENLKLLVFGSVEESIREEFNKLLVDNRVMYVGWINAMDSYDYFAAAKLVVFPGRHSVFWEQVAGQGIPMVCKYWDGTTHIDLDGNVEFIYEDQVETIRQKIEMIASDQECYSEMRNRAYTKRAVFRYSEIAKRSIRT